MNNEKIISDIKKIYEKYILKDVSSFCVDDYNDFENLLSDYMHYITDTKNDRVLNDILGRL